MFLAIFWLLPAKIINMHARMGGGGYVVLWGGGHCQAGMNFELGNRLTYSICCRFAPFVIAFLNTCEVKLTLFLAISLIICLRKSPPRSYLYFACPFLARLTILHSGDHSQFILAFFKSNLPFSLAFIGSFCWSTFPPPGL